MFRPRTEFSYTHAEPPPMLVSAIFPLADFLTFSGGIPCRAPSHGVHLNERPRTTHVVLRIDCWTIVGSELAEWEIYHGAERVTHEEPATET